MRCEARGEMSRDRLSARTNAGQLVRDPQQAAELIDTLMLLREKTEGHRTAEESQALDELIYDLHLRYVNATTSSR